MVLCSSDWLDCTVGRSAFLWFRVLRVLCVPSPVSADPGATKPSFTFLNSSAPTSSAPAPAAAGGMFGSSAAASSTPGTAFVFGQAGNPGSGPAFGSSAESGASQSLLFSQESKPATTSSAAAAVTPFVFGPGAGSHSTASSGFSFGATTTSSAAGTVTRGKRTCCSRPGWDCPLPAGNWRGPEKRQVPLGRLPPACCRRSLPGITSIWWFGLIS